MPRRMTIHDRRAAGPVAYCALADEGGVQVVGEDEQLARWRWNGIRLDEEFIPTGTLVFSVCNDGYAPWGTRDQYEDFNGFSPEDWSPPEPMCYDCDYPESECRCSDYSYDEDYDEGYGSYHNEETDDDPNDSDSPLRIPALPERPTRCMSMEIEVGRGGTYLAKQFHAAGLAESEHMHSYHSGAEGFVRVEEDASVGAEIIFSQMYLSRPGHAKKFEEGIGILRKALAEGKSKLDMRCGLHIHVGLNRDRKAGSAAYSEADCISLYNLWNYMEDTIFRLGSANWRGHRSEFGNEYSPLVPKREATRARDVSYGRCALNLSNYISTLQDPGYGGTIPTVEFRVFNTSANARKLRAYAALCQAMVSFAQDNKITTADYPVFQWHMNNEPDPAASAERIEFILTKLPLTNSEQEDIRYCIRKSSLARI